MPIIKRYYPAVLIVGCFGLIATILNACSNSDAATDPPTNSADALHIYIADLLKEHDTKMTNSVGNSSNPDSLVGLTSKLSDDIGLMAARIGDMADRIVDTEKLIVAVIANQTQAAQQVIDKVYPNNAFGEPLTFQTMVTAITASNAGNLGSVLTSPTEGATVSINTSPVVTYSTRSASNQYQLLISTNRMFPAGSTANVLVDTVAAPLNDSTWAQLMTDLGIISGANTPLFIAVSSIDAQGFNSPLSNSVKIIVN